MKYTEEELLDYIEENNLSMEMLTAIDNNDKEFSILEVKPNFIEKDSELYLDFPGGNPIKIDKNGDIDFLKNKNNDTMMAFVVMYNNETYLNIFEIEPDNKRKRRLNMMFLIAITTLKIDTKGKLKKFILRGQELFEEWQNTEKYLESLMDSEKINF